MDNISRPAFFFSLLTFFFSREDVNHRVETEGIKADLVSHEAR